VAALGNPMKLDGSITTGAVSGATRSMPTREGFAVPDTVRADAAITPGNSGGPLVVLGVESGDGDETGEANGDRTDSGVPATVVDVSRARGATTSASPSRRRSSPASSPR
jgi:hypothetical protein